MGITVIGAGLSGCEAAWQIARRGMEVDLYEMRPLKMTKAHETANFAELVCSNSLGSLEPTAASGLLKKELLAFDSLIIQCALETSVLAGGALAVDREAFSAKVTSAIAGEKNIRVIQGECETLPTGVFVLATGPLSSPAITKALQEKTREENLFFYDAAAPILLRESLLESEGFWAARYDKGTPDYFNCPLSKKEYGEFWEALVSALVTPIHSPDEDLPVFEGCMPIEVMAKRGLDTLRFGPLKPVGLICPKEQRRPYAVVQLRRENAAASLLNMVGFQTRLTFGEQKRVFRKIPALQNAEFVRLGVMHRNTYINAPRLLDTNYALKSDGDIFVAGQLSGVEGYVESVSSGLVAGLNAVRRARREEPLYFPLESLLGALPHYIASSSGENFQPMNANFGILPPLSSPARDKKTRKQQYVDRSLESLRHFLERGGRKGH